MQNKPSLTIENYLSLMFILERDGEPLMGTHLAELLGVTPPTVTNTLKRMARDGLVSFDQPGTHLTENGIIPKPARTATRYQATRPWWPIGRRSPAWRQERP
jgi:Mn-dependent DtxR family transcriptional regulator